VSWTDKERPGRPQALNARAIALLQSGDSARARGRLEPAVGIEPSNPSLWMNRATT